MTDVGVSPQGADAESDDPVLGAFLNYLAHDIANHPECLQTCDASFVLRLQSLAGSTEIDLDARLSAVDE